ncbi:MAG TPA: N-acetylmuramoyl-L-alanine amidase [Candidatus Sulfotelmatobacter sp.]
MATTPSKTPFEALAAGTEKPPGSGVPAWPRGARSNITGSQAWDPQQALESTKPARYDALQALLAFSALHAQIRRRRALAAPKNSLDVVTSATEFESGEQFVLDEVLQLVAERAVSITGANGIAIALAENNEIVLRASAGQVKPDIGARIDRDSAFSGACFRNAQIVRCDDSEVDDRVNAKVCRALGARAMVAVPLCGRRRVIGLLEAFSAEAFGFNDSDVRSLSLLAELVVGALKPEDEDRFAESAKAASSSLGSTPTVSHSAQPPLSSGVNSDDVLEIAAAPLNVSPLDALSSDEDDVLESAEGYALSGKSSPSRLQESGDDNGVLSGDNMPPERRPGLAVVLILIAIFALAAGAIWWIIRNSQRRTLSGRGQNLTSQSRTDSAGASPSVAAPSSGDSLTAKPLLRPESKPGQNELSEPAPDATPADALALAKLPKVTGIRHWSSADSSTVVLDLQDQVQYEAHRLTSPDRIYFDLHDTVLAPEIATSIEVGDTLLNRVRVAQPLPGMTRVVLETRGNSNFSVSLETNPYRLVVEVRKIGANPKNTVNLFPDKTAFGRDEVAIVVPPPTKEDLQLRARISKMRIVVDAGHGGWDLGTVGRRGLLEKDVVLEIGQRLGKLLESRLGMDVLYTRHDDNYIPLDERAQIANQWQADLFISVHANYSDLPSARGVETYYTNFFSTPNSKDLETRAAANLSPVAPMLSPADLHDRIEQSRRLAASVQRSLFGTLSVQNPGLRDRGIKEAGFVVLTETSMPGILAEISFVSSPADEQRLRSDGYREEIAEALYKGIARYAADSHTVKVASAAGK